MLIIWLPIAHQTEMTEKHRKITVTNGYKNKIVGKFIKTLQLFGLYSHSKYNIVLVMFVGKYL